MNLKELLLQFAGESGESLKLEDLITNNISDIEVDEELDSGIRLLVKDPAKANDIKSDIQDLLEKSGYNQYTITPIVENTMHYLLVEVD